MQDEERFVNSLLKVAKELEKANYVKKFKAEFENELKNGNEEKTKSSTSEEISPSENSNSSQDSLQMEVFEDKEYDIEEVKFWNFISKNKGIKPSIIRTIVYKVPEAAYLVRKVPVVLPKPEKPAKQTEELSKETSNSDEKKIVSRAKNTSNLIKLNKAQVSKQFVEAVKLDEKADDDLDVLKLKPIVAPFIRHSPTNSKSEIQRFFSTKYKMEDLIMIDEDEDVLGLNEDEADSEEKNDESELDVENEKGEDDDSLRPEIVIEKIDEPNLSMKHSKLKRAQQTQPNETAQKFKKSKLANEENFEGEKKNDRVTRSKSRFTYK